MLIRRAEEIDCGGIYRVHVAAVRILCSAAYSSHEIEGWIGDKSPSSYVGPIRDREMFVATDSGSVVGFGQLNLETAEVEAVYVDPAVVRTGVGGALLREIEVTARDHGVRTLCLSSSTNAVAFYESAGYRRIEAAIHRLKNGAEIACVKMDKHLAQEGAGTTRTCTQRSRARHGTDVK